MDLTIKPNLATVNNVAIGQVFSADLPIGPTYAFYDIEVTMTSASAKTLSGGVADFLDLQTLQINSKAQRTFVASEIDNIYKKFGANYGALIFNSTGSGNSLVPVYSSGVPQAPQANAQTTCRVRYYFQEPWRKTWAGANSRQLYTLWPVPKGGGKAYQLSSLQVQGLIPSTTNNAGATSVSVRIYTGTNGALGPMAPDGVTPIVNMLKIYRSPISYTASGDQQLNNFIKYDKGNVLAIVEQIDFVSGSAGDDITRIVCQADSRVVRDVTVAENNDDLLRHGFNAPWNVDAFTLCFDVTDSIQDGLVLSTPGGSYVNTFTVTATLNQAAGSNKVINVLSQVWGPVD